MKRHESRNKSRSRTKIQILNPCVTYAHSAGINPFSYIFASIAAKEMAAGKDIKKAEQHAAHQVKMMTDQKTSKASQNRKRNKV